VIRRRGGRMVHVLMLNTRDALQADVSVHVSLARALDRRRVRVSVATSAYEAAGESARAAFASIPYLRLMTCDLGRPLSSARGAGRVAAAARIVRAMVVLVSLAGWCRRNCVDIVHVTERPRDVLFGLILARLAGSRCLIHAHTSYYRYDESRWSNWTLRRAAAVVGVSRFTAGTFVAAGGLPPDRVFAVHNAVDGSRFRSDLPASEELTVRSRLGVPASVPLVGCVARLSRWKDQATLLEAMLMVRNKIPDARLVLAGLAADSSPDGVGDYRDYLHRRVEALGLQGAVTFAGFLPQHEMPSFYAALDVLAHPAVEEPFGLAIVEAMACARPVVAVGAGGVPEIIRHGIDGLLVPVGDASSMAEALSSVLRDEALATRLADSARTRVCTAFTPDLQAATITAIYEQVLSAQL
jgi:glycosyltransferase involved in cell wall biosynthesis